MPEQDPRIGSVLEGRYRILGLLGRGGMGNVYLAEETRLGRRCALKALHPRLAEDRSQVARFLREAQAIARFDHPNIVDIHSFGEDPRGAVFFAMELLQGEDLDARVRGRASRPYTTREACEWAIQIARAVAVVHDAGMIHRDLKGTNIFLARRRDGSEVVKLLDFGIARPEAGSELTSTGVSLGTPTHMSPEQFINGDLDRRSDVYSFGVLLFKLLVGRVPFRGEPIQIAMQHCSAPRPAPSAAVPDGLSNPLLDAIVVRAMAIAPADRFPTMHAVERALLAALEDERTTLVAPGRLPRPAASASMSTAAGASEPAPEAPAGAAAPAPGPAPENASGSTQTLASAAPGRGSQRLRLTGAVGVIALLPLLVALVGSTLSGGSDPDRALAAPTPAPLSPRPPEPRPNPPVEAPETDAEPPAAAPEPTRPELATPPEPEPPASPPPPERKKRSERPATTEKPTSRAAAPPPTSPAPADPLPDPDARMRAGAHACRRTHNAVSGAPVLIEYAVNGEGEVIQALASTETQLSECIVRVVTDTKFPPGGARSKQTVRL